MEDPQFPVEAADRLADWLQRAARRLGPAEGDLSVAVVDDTAMSELHERYKGEPGPTDVLTFDLRDDATAAPDPAQLDGEIVVCWPEAQRQAAQAEPARDPEHELLLYAVHGLLHLLGEDDQTPEAYAKMHAREDRVLADIGVGAVFAPSREAAAP